MAGQSTHFLQQIKIIQKKKKGRGARLVQSVEHETLDLGVVSLSPTLGVQIT